MMGKSWFFSRGDQQAGPVEWEALCAMGASGELTATSLVWTEGLMQWCTASSITGLIPNTAAPVPTMPYGRTDVGYYAVHPLPRSYAGFWLRFIAAIVDGILVQIMSFVVGVLATGALVSTGPQAAGSAGSIRGLLGICTAWLYFALFESSSRQATLGKSMLSIKVTDTDGNRISFGQATGRYFAKIISGLIFLIGYMMAGWTEKKQALHDIMASCLVVREV